MKITVEFIGLPEGADPVDLLFDGYPECLQSYDLGDFGVYRVESVKKTRLSNGDILMSAKLVSRNER